MQTIKDILKETNQSRSYTMIKLPEDVVLEDLVRDFGNGNSRTVKNLSFIVKTASISNNLDQVNKIRAEVKADSNSSTRSQTAVFVSRCLKELNIKLNGDSFSSTEKWLYKILHATEEDLLCNTDLFFELGRYEKKTFNKIEKVFNNDNNSFFKITFEIANSKADNLKIVDILDKPFGKLEVLLELAIHREFIKQYAIFNQNPENSILKYEENNSDFIIKRPYIILPSSALRGWLWGNKNFGDVKRIEETILRFNRERLSFEIGEGLHVPEGYLKLKRYRDSIRPYEIETIKLELKTTKGVREAVGYKIVMHEFFFDMLIKLHQANKYKPEIFTKLRDLSEREIKLYLLISKYESYKSPFIVLNEELLGTLGIDTTSPRFVINQAIRRTVNKINEKINEFSVSISDDYSKLLISKD